MSGYQWEFTLKKTGVCEWGIYSSSGTCIYALPGCTSQEMAMHNANAWVSSWSSSVIRTEDEQQIRQTDRVPSKT